MGGTAADACKGQPDGRQGREKIFKLRGPRLQLILYPILIFTDIIILWRFKIIC